MIKAIFAYVIVFFLAPTISGLLSFLFIPLLVLIGKLIGEEKAGGKIWAWYCDLFGGVVSIITGFIAIWIGKNIFYLLSKSPTLFMVVMLGIGFILNDFRRISHSSKAIIRGEIIAGFGHILGIILGAVYILLK